MKSIALSAVLAVAALSSESLAAVSLKLAKTRHPTKVSRRHILPRQNLYLELLNNVTGGSYAAKISVGSPPQEQNLAIDTGSSDVWFLDSEAEICTDPYALAMYGGCSSSFDSSRSTSFKITEEGRFNITYLDGSAALGDYITDDVGIGGETIKGQQLGLAYDVSLTTGIMGIGFTENVASNSPRNQGEPFTYPTLIDQMFEQGVINLKAYSLYLDAKSSDTGSIIFGGLDSDKWVGELLQLPLVPSLYPNGTEVYDHFTVVMTGLSITSGSSNTSLTSSSFRVPVVLDSGTTLTYLPEVTTRRIYNELDAVDDTAQTGLTFVDCGVGNDPTLSFDYTFGDSSNDVHIRVPISELLYDLNEIFTGGGYERYLPNLPFNDVCVIGILPASSGVSILGDTFLRSAYVVYDLQNKVVAMAQTNFNSTSENIMDFQANATRIPEVSGVASSVDVTQTATGILGGGDGGRPLPTSRVTSTSVITSGGGAVVTITETASTNAATTSAAPRNGAGRSVPAVENGAFLVLGISVVLAAFGGGLLLV